MSIIKKLDHLGPGDLPTPPSVALEIVHACSDDSLSSEQIGKIASSDTALLSELLRIANSPFFGVNKSITSAKKAIVVLGQRSLRNMALCFAARESLRPDVVPEMDTESYWEEVLRRAVSARILAEVIDVDADEAFTIGMLQDFGLLTMFLICPEHGKEWIRLRDSNPDDRLLLEMEIFGATHDAVGGIMADNWGLPEPLTVPIAYHHADHIHDFSVELQKMISVAACADWMAAVFTVTDKRLALVKCHQLMTECFGLDETAIDELLKTVPVSLLEAASAIGITVAEQASYEDVLVTSNKQLIEQPEIYEDQTARIEKALEARERLANDIHKAYKLLTQLAYYDPLTTLVNRRRFEELFSAEIGRHCRSGNSLSLIMIDIDNYKKINDEYGHAFGDEVLQSVAIILKGNLRGSDIAARLGGDEMCLLLPETDEKGGRITAQRVHKAIGSIVINKKKVKVTASFGGCSWRIENYDKDKLNELMKSIDIKDVMKSIMKAADKALYQSKKDGRNTITWETLNPPD